MVSELIIEGQNNSGTRPVTIRYRPDGPADEGAVRDHPPDCGCDECLAILDAVFAHECRQPAPAAQGQGGTVPQMESVARDIPDAPARNGELTKGRDRKRGHADPKLPHGSGFARCAACGCYFKSVAGFDKHRVGPVEARRCLAPDEMRAKGMRISERGYWITRAYDRDAS